MTESPSLEDTGDVQQAVDAIAAWLDANTWVDLNDDEAYMVDAIMHGARLLKWLPLDLKLPLVESWGLQLRAAGVVPPEPATHDDEDHCPECGGEGIDGCGAAWHDSVSPPTSWEGDE